MVRAGKFQGYTVKNDPVAMTHQPVVASTQVPLSHLWTVEEYHQLVKAQLVGVNEPAELIAGQIIRFAPAYQVCHARNLRRLGAMLQRCVGARAQVRSHLPITLDLHSEPRPDLAVVQGDAARFRYHNPGPEEIALLLEVAAAQLSFAGGLKAKAYAQAGIQDYWILDAYRTQLHIFRDPAPSGYQQRRVLQAGDAISPLAFQDTVASLQSAVPVYFLTRRLRGRQSQVGNRLPLTITRHPHRTVPERSSPVETAATPMLAEQGAADRPLAMAPQPVPSPRFLPSLTQPYVRPEARPKAHTNGNH